MENPVWYISANPDFVSSVTLLFERAKVLYECKTGIFIQQLFAMRIAQPVKIRVSPTCIGLRVMRYTPDVTSTGRIFAKALNTMETILYASGDFDNAKHHFEKSSSMYESLHGSNHHRTAKRQLNLSYSLIQEGRIEEGNELFDLAMLTLESPDLEFDFLASDEITRYLPLFEEHNTEALANLKEFDSLRTAIKSEFSICNS